MNLIDGILNRLDELAKRILMLESQSVRTWVMLTSPLTSTSWDGDSYSTTAKTKIDLSSVFSAPAGIKAILALVVINDSASDTTTSSRFIILSPNNTADQGMTHRIEGVYNDAKHTAIMVVPCDSSGDVYYQIAASGSSTMDVTIQIWGYLI